MTRSALDVLLNGGRRRLYGLRLTTLVTLCLAVGFGGLEYGILRVQGERNASTETLATLAVALLAVLPFLAAANLSRLLDGMRRSRFLADVQLTLLSPRVLCDTLAWRAVGAVAVPGGVFGLLLYTNPDLASMVLPWYGGLLLGTLAVSYLAEVQALWRSHEGLGWWDRIMLWCLVSLSSVPMAVAGIQGSGFLPATFLALVLLAVMSRSLALVYLKHGDALSGFGRTFLRRLRPQAPNPYLRNSSMNPVVYRDMAVVASRIPGGRMGALLWRFSGVVLAVPFVLVHWALASLVPPCTGAPHIPLAFLAAQIVVMVYGLRVFWNCWQTVVRDKPHLELLSTTCLTAAEYVDGLAQSAALPRLWETCMALIALAALSLTKDTALVPLAWGGQLLCLPLGVYGTVYLASRSKNLMEAAIRFYIALPVFQLAVAIPGGMIFAFVYQFIGLIPAMITLVGWGVICYVLALQTLRNMAIRQAGAAFAQQ